MTMIKKAAALAAASTVVFGAVAPMVASAQTVAAVPVNAFFLGGGGGSGISSGNLGSLFVLGSLFSGPYGNGVIGNGTSLGGLLMLNQIFNNNSGWYW